MKPTSEYMWEWYKENYPKLEEENLQLKSEIELLKIDYGNACQTVAKMHEAVVGKVCGPIRGVVEDVADLRTALEALKK